mmetsp:Transcript_21207/g.34068  ORF Transcript_21207/g.34068 Transcript_21207/m.34068 type:complete len:80 (+) Transcript_21207:804-1043(+)
MKKQTYVRCFDSIIEMNTFNLKTKTNSASREKQKNSETYFCCTMVYTYKISAEYKKRTYKNTKQIKFANFVKILKSFIF